MRAHIRQVVAGFVPDVVQIEWTETGAYLDAVPSGEAYGFWMKWMSVTGRSRILRNSGVRGGRWVMRAGAAACASQRAGLVRRFDAVLTRSEHDRQVLLAQDPGCTSRSFTLDPCRSVCGVTAQELCARTVAHRGGDGPERDIVRLFCTSTTMFSLSSGAIVRLSSCGSWVRIHHSVWCVLVVTLPLW